MGSLRERCARVFEVCDEGNKGYLDREDFEVAVVMLFGYKLSEVEVDSIMSSVRPENSGILFEKFLSLMSAKKSAQRYGDETREIFTAFDVQDRGFLTFEDFKKTFNSVLPKLSERIIIEAFSSHGHYFKNSYCSSIYPRTGFHYQSTPQTHLEGASTSKKHPHIQSILLPA
ncbi:EF-hand calcium-binding domain-containing protein 11 isoform X2 [Excalfactoria chinensis]|uniref:EF-hand calcium-binding domain-containing protein 11 isoform X2 n=1 Tax=Excalfactoria chinensis TaxID=46218 RepID=UPI003B3B149C